MCGFFGDKESFGRICRLCCFLDDLLSRISKAKGKKKRRMQKAADRMRWKIRDLILEIHHKTANFLCKTFDIILIPSFEVSEMVVKLARNLRSKTVRAMLTWAHYRFKQILKSKCELMSCQIFDDLSEAYTSKTCSACGWIDQKLGGKKVFKCKSCKSEIDRDVNGARGFFLRSVIKLGISI
jgi:putative transposase